MSAPTGCRYEKVPFSRGSGTGIYTSGRLTDKVIAARHNLPGSIILVHGVNDIGTSYEAVENGLCAGLTERLRGDIRPATYRNPTPEDAKKIVDDPDAVFYKRTIGPDTHSPVIPFYWGFREEQAHAQPGNTTPHGQALDRYGNRLDKDFSKGGGPFSNATNSLSEMWARGKSKAWGLLDYFQGDATHPVLDNPGRLYMVLAARRLAALITMIRDYHPDETVSIVAHSQGCMISLLAQAFLLETGDKALQENARPADTLVLCNPPYSLVEDVPMAAKAINYYSGSDAAMKGRYATLIDTQTLHARLSTLANIVTGIQKHKHAAPPLAELPDVNKHFGVVGGRWVADQDRDNRGKVYLYFSPEDMTVALANVQGIGWHGVPDYMRGTQVKPQPFHLTDSDGEPLDVDATITKAGEVVRRPLVELGKGFRQRIFTLKRRPDFHNGLRIMIGPKASPYDFVLRGDGEDDQAHTAVSDSGLSRHAVRARLEIRGHYPDGASLDEAARFGLRRITGEALPKPFMASMGEGAFADAKGRYGASEQVDQIDAAISITSQFGIDKNTHQHWECFTDLIGVTVGREVRLMASPKPELFSGVVASMPELAREVSARINRNRGNFVPEKMFVAIEVYVCVDDVVMRRPSPNQKLLIRREETADEARLRWQGARVAHSFHGAIYGGSKNHQFVTAYDVAIGKGTATTHPLFYAYLCAVADWRLKKPTDEDKLRNGILLWEDFQKKYAVYWKDEPCWRAELIEGNVDYYSNGKLPSCLPLPPEGMPSTFVLQSFSDGCIEFKGTKR
jgi:pimeloyl-ACP methyl ester carboxylesterase